MNIINYLKPGISKRYLLFVASSVWIFASGMLFFRGFLLLSDIHSFKWLIVLISIIGGLIFYTLLFSKISLKHTNRIILMQIEKPCLFSFFSFKSYFMMMIMISSGILLRKSGILPISYLTTIYITMGIPLLLSSFRFSYNGIHYHRLKHNNKFTS
jgi:hypothetical protein